MVTTLVADLYIVVSLCGILHQAKTGFQHTENIISKLILYAVPRGVLVFLMQLVCLILLINDLQNYTLKMSITYFPLSTLNVNMALAVLNARNHVRASPASSTI
ncbi:hypothetical protein AcV7_002340 [Taiwanofungus camphoratus]|nr:hypothetical protein AcV7_002340 [Antrodia cinnamomea]